MNRLNEWVKDYLKDHVRREGSWIQIFFLVGVCGINWFTTRKQEPLDVTSNSHLIIAKYL